MVGNYINTIKTTFYYNFDDIRLLNSMDTHESRTQEKLSIKKASHLLNTNLQLEISLLTIKAEKKKSSSLYLYNSLPL